MNKKLIIIICNAILLSSGIMLILVSSVQYTNFWPLITVFVDIFALFFPTFCNGCDMGDDDDFSWGGGGGRYDEDRISEGAISWVLLGIIVMIGFAIPIELFRVHKLSEIGAYLTVSGSTVILSSIVIFVRVIYFEKDNHYSYLI